MYCTTISERHLSPLLLQIIRKFEPVAAEKDGIKVEFNWHGEGKNGIFDPNDPNDKMLLRFTVYKVHGVDWGPIEDSSYCTLIPIDTIESILFSLAKYILDKVYYHVKEYKKIKGICSKLSHIKIQDVIKEEDEIDGD